MSLTHYMTKEYENKSGLLTMEKQTQSNPTCSELVEPIASQPPHFSKNSSKTPIFLIFLSFFPPFFSVFRCLALKNPG